MKVHVPVTAGSKGLWCREVWMAGTAQCLQSSGVWPHPPLVQIYGPQ